MATSLAVLRAFEALVDWKSASQPSIAKKLQLIEFAAIDSSHNIMSEIIVRAFTKPCLLNSRGESFKMGLAC